MGKRKAGRKGKMVERKEGQENVHVSVTKRTSLVVQTVKCLPTMWETWCQSLGQEDPLEEGLASHSSIPAWRLLWTEDPGGLQSIGKLRLD